MVTKKIDPNSLKVRDPLMVKLINGATKSGVVTDRKKEASRRRCRGRRKNEQGQEE